jgi:uncharacterized protein YjiS (DUF1127 family)
VEWVDPRVAARSWAAHRSRRRRNLAELRALDSGRLQDIGLSEAARARMVG